MNQVISIDKSVSAHWGYKWKKLQGITEDISSKQAPYNAQSRSFLKKVS